ncbi:hypothetical protein IE81DRAFT_319243 [Ceraceosorus guamensis]|uniref:Uncharacterized protein n=1 Tax=Ceraceosorus guamensis TaxID=1522189 RepID=A0A316WCJ9_9BASI|nr:hypothetical protein IE81DRAFT_319243 [Ceraceosorus guamensis]PWN46341.1 hypothetical protein IE81DRAFT_319243 [Ceraceosorus guamensis]
MTIGTALGSELGTDPSDGVEVPDVPALPASPVPPPWLPPGPFPAPSLSLLEGEAAGEDAVDWSPSPPGPTDIVPSDVGLDIGPPALESAELPLPLGPFPAPSPPLLEDDPAGEAGVDWSPSPPGPTEIVPSDVELDVEPPALESAELPLPPSPLESAPCGSDPTGEEEPEVAPPSELCG